VSDRDVCPSQSRQSVWSPVPAPLLHDRQSRRSRRVDPAIRCRSAGRSNDDETKPRFYVADGRPSHVTRLTNPLPAAVRQRSHLCSLTLPRTLSPSPLDGRKQLYSVTCRFFQAEIRSEYTFPGPHSVTFCQNTDFRPDHGLSSPSFCLVYNQLYSSKNSIAITRK